MCFKLWSEVFQCFRLLFFPETKFCSLNNVSSNVFGGELPNDGKNNTEILDRKSFTSIVIIIKECQCRKHSKSSETVFVVCCILRASFILLAIENDIKLRHEVFVRMLWEVLLANMSFI
jgi:hypothetical protein